MEVTIITDTNTYNISIDRMTRLEDIIRGQGIPCPFLCDGTGTCGKCRVKFLSDPPKPSKTDMELLGERLVNHGYRLACEAIIIKDSKIYIPDESEVKSVELFDVDAIGKRALERHERVIEAHNNLQANHHMAALNINDVYGIAIDLGTTAIALELFNYKSGELIATTVVENHQAMYGYDLEARIESSIRGNQYVLKDIVVRDILNGLRELGRHLPDDVNIQDIPIGLAGNTAMIHMLCDMSCAGLLEPPYEPQELASQVLELQDGLIVTTFPAIAAYIGGDIVSAMYALDVTKENEVNVLIDLGTNGEMIVSNHGSVNASNIAMGPAIEGGGISCGCASIAGAIRSVEISNRFCKVKTIDNAYAIGVCGSGAIEAVYEFYKNGIIDEHGNFSAEFRLGYQLCQLNQKQSIIFTQDDVRKLQLTKAAIRASIDVLLKKSGLTYGQVDNVYLAGGVGYGTAIDKMIGIGALPKAWKNRVVPVGNACLEGVRQFLMEHDVKRLGEIVESVNVVDITQEGIFQDEYLDNVLFGER